MDDRNQKTDSNRVHAHGIRAFESFSVVVGSVKGSSRAFFCQFFPDSSKISARPTENALFILSPLAIAPDRRIFRVKLKR